MEVQAHGQASECDWLRQPRMSSPTEAPQKPHPTLPSPTEAASEARAHRQARERIRQRQRERQQLQPPRSARAPAVQQRQQQHLPQKARCDETAEVVAALYFPASLTQPMQEDHDALGTPEWALNKKRTGRLILGFKVTR